MRPANIRRFLAVLLTAAVSDVCADGTLTHMSGIVSILKADGKTIPGTPGAKAYPGDTIITGTTGYVRMEMTDRGEVVLRPDSQLKIESYKFVETKAAEDNFVFSMLRGGLRTVTGLIGKRGSKDAYELKTPTATIGIRGTQFDLRVCQSNCGALTDGTYLAVRFGAVQTSNQQGSLAVAAGQVAHVPAQRPPVILPRDPGIGFTPPAVIPKLDEKKKVQPTAAAAPAPEQAKPAAAGSAQSSQTSSRSGQGEAKSESAQESSSKQESADSGKKDAASKTETGSGASTSNKPAEQSQASGSSSAAADQSSSTAAAPQASPAAQSSASASPAAASLAVPAATQAVSGGDCSIQ